MLFSTQQMKIVQTVINTADEATLKCLLASIETKRLRRIMQTMEHSLKNRDPYYSCRCPNCDMHDINREDGVELCDSCLAE